MPSFLNEGKSKVPRQFQIKLAGHGRFDFGIGSDKYSKKTKKELAELVADTYSDADTPAYRGAEYWMKYPYIVLLAIVGDTYGDGR